MIELTTPPRQGYDTILAQVRTTHERDILKGALDALVKNLYHTKPKPLGEIAEELLPYAINKALVASLGLAHATNDATAMETFFAGLAEALSGLRVIKLELAFEPQEETMAIISRWVRQHVGGDSIIDASVDPLLLGGVRIAFAGKYREVNLADMIESALIREEPRIQEMLL